MGEARFTVGGWGERGGSFVRFARIGDTDFPLFDHFGVCRQSGNVRIEASHTSIEDAAWRIMRIECESKCV